jgi:hypothetical protein
LSANDSKSLKRYALTASAGASALMLFSRIY